MSEEINLTTLFTLIAQAIKKQWLLVLVLFSIGAVTAFIAVSVLLPKKYISQAVLRSAYLSAADIEMNMNHVNSVLIANSVLPTNYLPYEGCKSFSIKSEGQNQVPEGFLATYHTNVTVELETTSPSTVHDVTPAIKQYFDTNATYLEVKLKKHKALRQMVSSLEKVSEDLQASIQSTKMNSEELLFIPNTYNEIASAKVILDEDQIIRIVQPFSPAKEKSNNALALALVSGLLFVIAGFLIKGFIEA